MKFYNEINPDTENGEIISREMVEIIQRIWQSSGVQLVYKRRFNYQLLDNAKLFVLNFHAFIFLDKMITGRLFYLSVQLHISSLQRPDSFFLNF